MAGEPSYRTAVGRLESVARFALGPYPTPVEEMPLLRQALGPEPPRRPPKREDANSSALVGQQVRKGRRAHDKMWCSRTCSCAITSPCSPGRLDAERMLGFASGRRWKSRSHGGRPHLSSEIRDLIATKSRDNRLWGTERMRGELLKLGIVVSNRSIRRDRWRGSGRAPTQNWCTFLSNHAHHLWAADLLSVPTLTFKTLHVLVFIAHGRPALVHVHVTANPTGAWV